MIDVSRPGKSGLLLAVPDMEDGQLSDQEDNFCFESLLPKPDPVVEETKQASIQQDQH